MSRQKYTDQELLRDILWTIEHEPYGISLSAIHKYSRGSRHRVAQLLEQLRQQGRIQRQPIDPERPELGQHYTWDFNYAEDEQFELRNDPPPHKPATFHGNERTLQKVLIDGLDCLPDQQDLF